MNPAIAQVGEEVASIAPVVRRTLDAAFLNSVANGPDVRPHLGGEGVLDLTGAISNPRNITLQTDHGGWILIQHEPGAYELHTMLLKSGRGLVSAAASRAMFRYVFAGTDAREIYTKVPESNPQAKAAALFVGFQEWFHRGAAFKAAGGEMVGVSYQVMTLNRWTARSADALAEGRWFHTELETALAGSNLPPHPEDEYHDRVAGASCLMMRCGNARKAAWSYNRWAALAGYDPIKLLSDAPIIVDVGAGVVVEVRDGKMEILRCP